MWGSQIIEKNLLIHRNVEQCTSVGHITLLLLTEREKTNKTECRTECQLFKTMMANMHQFLLYTNQSLSAATRMWN